MNSVVHIVIEDIQGKPSNIIGVYTTPRAACDMRDFMRRCAEKTPDYTYRAESYLAN